MSDTHSETASDIGYVRTEEVPTRPPPPSEIGIQGWLRQNLLSSMSDFSSVSAAISSVLMMLLTAGVLFAGVWLVWSFFSFTVLNAVWTDPEGIKRLACATTLQGGELPEDWSGACWPYVDAKWKVFTYGRYPGEELWRPDLVFLIGGFGIAWLVSDGVPRRRIVGIALLVAAAALWWWSSLPIEVETEALLNDPARDEYASPLGALWDAAPVGVWIMAAIGLLYALLPSDKGRGLVAVLMLTAFPLLAYILLTGGDAEGGTGFWIGLLAAAAFGLLLWGVGRFVGAGAAGAAIISAAIVAVAAYLLWQWVEPLRDMGIALPIPADTLQLILAVVGVAGLVFLFAGMKGVGLGLRLLLAVPALLLVFSAYGSGPLSSVTLPVGWVILVLLGLALLGFVALAITGLSDRTWHAAVTGFGSSAGRMLALGALVVGVIAFLGGHWFVDLIELTARGELDRFLSAEHIAAANANEHIVERVVWPLPEVETELWGGLLVTLVVAIVGIVASLPLGILVALGRRSQLPAVRFLSVAYIEFWRGVPLITVLFMSSVMLPLFLPDGVEFNKLLRALIGVALFASAYMAEVVRGGLQAIPKGQYEGAASLGLGYWQMMRLIVMPQALTLVIPGVVNTFIGLFKDTTLVLIIGLFDLLGQIQQTFNDSSWATPVTQPTGYVVAAGIFFAFCFGMSRYSMYIERRLRRGHAR